MKLNVIDRVHLTSIIPHTGDRLTLAIIEGLGKKLNLTDEEVKYYNVRQIGDKLYYDRIDEFKDFSFSDMEKVVISQALSEKEAAKTLDLSEVNLYDMFIQGKPNRNMPKEEFKEVEEAKE